MSRLIALKLFTGIISHTSYPVMCYIAKQDTLVYFSWSITMLSDVTCLGGDAVPTL